MAKTNKRKVTRAEASPKPELSAREVYARQRRVVCREILKHRFLRQPIPRDVRNLDDLTLTNRHRVAHVRDQMRADGAGLEDLDKYIAFEIPIE